MKKLNKTMMLISALLFALAFTACGNNQAATEQTSKSADSAANGNTVVVSSIQVKDSATTPLTLGYLLSSTPWFTTIMSSTGYMYAIRWDGNLHQSPETQNMFSLNYTGTNCLPANFVGISGGGTNAAKYYGKMVFYDGDATQVLVPKFTNADGTAVIYTGLAIIGSTRSLSSPGTCNNFGGSMTNGIELKYITKTAAGIPSTITAPIQLSY